MTTEATPGALGSNDQLGAVSEAGHTTIGGWIVDVEIGDKLMPIPLWNKTERRPNQLHEPTEVLDIVTGECQSGFLFLVRKVNTSLEWMDAEWFEPPNVGANRAAEGGPRLSDQLCSRWINERTDE